MLKHSSKNYIVRLWFVMIVWWRMVGISMAEPISETTAEIKVELLNEDERKSIDEKVAPFLKRLKEKTDQLIPKMRASVEEKLEKLINEYLIEEDITLEAESADKIENNSMIKQGKEHEDEHNQSKEKIIPSIERGMSADEIQDVAASIQNEINENEMEQLGKQINLLTKETVPMDENGEELTIEQGAVNDDESQKAEVLDQFVTGMRESLDTLVPEMQLSMEDMQNSIDMQLAALQKTLKDNIAKAELTDEVQNESMIEHNEESRNEDEQLTERIISPMEDELPMEEKQDESGIELDIMNEEKLPQKMEELASLLEEITEYLDILVPKMLFLKDHIKTSIEIKLARGKQKTGEDSFKKDTLLFDDQLPFSQMPMGLGLGIGNMLPQLGMSLGGLNGMLGGMQFPGLRSQVKSENNKREPRQPHWSQHGTRFSKPNANSGTSDGEFFEDTHPWPGEKREHNDHRHHTKWNDKDSRKNEYANSQKNEKHRHSPFSFT